jgi:hypothetical protein
MICSDLEQHCAGVEGLGAVESTRSRWFAVNVEKNGAFQLSTRSQYKEFLFVNAIMCKV